MSNLINLKELYLGGNQLRSLPDYFGNFQQLEVFMVEINQIKILPESFWTLINLKRLRLGSNQLTTLSEAIANLKKVTVLYLQRNQLIALPAGLGQLSGYF